MAISPINIANNILKAVNNTGKEANRVISSLNSYVESKNIFAKKHFSEDINKDTIIGSLLILGATNLAIQCCKGIFDKVKEIKNDK